MKPIPLRERLVVRLAVGMISVALLSLVLSVALQFLSVAFSDIQPPKLRDRLETIIAENPDDPELLELIETPIRIRNIVARSGAFSLLISGALWIFFAIRFSRSIAKPIERVTLASAQITGGDLATRVHMPQNAVGEPAQLLEHFNQMASSLEAYENERTAMVASIAHELRTPLAVMKARLELMEEGIVALDQSEVARLNAQTDLLTRLVNDLRTLSLADANRLSLQLQETDLHELVKHTAHSLKPRMDEKTIQLEMALEDVTLTLDPQRLEQVLINLLDNALKHTPEGGSVKVSLEKDGEHSYLKIHDSGPGFEVPAAQLFKRFYTSDESQSSGTGLGLSLVDALIKLHGGQVSASNHPEGGAIFEVELPL